MNNVRRIKLDPHRMMKSMIEIHDIEGAFMKVFQRLDVSQATKQDYQSRITEFWYLIVYHGLHEDSLLEYKQLLASDNSTTVATKNKRLTVARLFLREMYRMGMIPRDITAGVKNFKQSGLHKTSGMDDKDLKKIRDWFHDGQPITRHRVRVYAMLMLLAYQGFRQIEICRLSVDDIDFENCKAMIVGKGQHDKQPVHLHKAVVAILQAYCKEYGIVSGPLFFSLSNSSYGMPLTTRGLRRVVTTVLERLDIDRTVHGFRHYYTTKLIKAYRGDLFRVMQFTRHKSLTMLQVYNDEVQHEAQYPVHDRIFAGVL
jgi:integrase